MKFVILPPHFLLEIMNPISPQLHQALFQLPEPLTIPSSPHKADSLPHSYAKPRVLSTHRHTTSEVSRHLPRST